MSVGVDLKQDLDLVWFLGKLFVRDRYVVVGDISDPAQDFLSASKDVVIFKSVQHALASVIVIDDIAAIVHVVETDADTQASLSDVSALIRKFGGSADYILVEPSGRRDLAAKYTRLLSASYLCVRPLPFIRSLSGAAGRAVAVDPRAPESQRMRSVLGAWRSDQSRIAGACDFLHALKGVAVPQGELAAKAKALQREVDRATAELAQLRTSNSWKITTPLRVGGGAARRLLSVGRRVHFAVSSRGGALATSKALVSIVRREGVKGLKTRLVRATGHGSARPESEIAYQRWIEQFDTYSDDALARVRSYIDTMPQRPTFSFVVPTYNTSPALLKEMVDSVLAQIYPHWELCIADDASTDAATKNALAAQAKRDARIKVVYRNENGHISAASNSALALASGEFVVLLDHDDAIPRHALFVVAEYVNRHPDAQLFYSDEDKISEDGTRFGPYFKPDWNVELIRSQNFFSHLGVYRRDLIERVGGFREAFEGAQDYDLMLRCVDAARDTPPVHIPHVLYHWRVVAGSTAGGSDAKPYAFIAAMRSLSEHLARRGVSGEVVESTPNSGYTKIDYAVPDPAPLVSIVIPTRDGRALLSNCITSLLDITAYKNFEIIIVDNGSTEPATFEYFESISNLPNVRILRDDSPFNYSALNNRAVEIAQGEFICLMNNDIEAIHPEWLTEMVGIGLQPDVGAVGARLWYPDDRLQHGGVILGIGGVAGHAHHLLKPEESGYFSRAVLAQDLSAVTAACLLVRTRVYREVGGLDEQLAVAFNDVDFCIRVRDAGYRNVWTPYAQLYHHESATRGSDLSPGKRERFAREVMFMQDRWGDTLLNDPAYNPNLSLVGNDRCFATALAPRIDLPLANDR